MWPLACFNKVLLAHSYATHFYITYGAFTTRVQLSCPDRDQLTQKAELSYPWPFAAWCRGVRAELGAQEEVRLWGN